MKLIHLVQYLPLRFIVLLVRGLPAAVALRLGRGLGRLAYYVDRHHRRVVLENMALALGLTGGGAVALARRSFLHLGEMFVEFLRPDLFGREFIRDRVVVEGLENVRRAREEGKGVLLLTAHLGNWELLGAALLEHLGPLTVVYKEPVNPYVNRFIRTTRAMRGIEIIPHRNAARKIMALLRKGGTVGILLDQHATNKDAVRAEFFGQDVATNYGLALIALKTGTPVLPAFLVKEDDGRYRCIYEPPIVLEKRGETEADILEATNRFNGIMEGYIRRYPEQWFWVHNRFRDRNRRRGKKKRGRRRRRSAG